MKFSFKFTNLLGTIYRKGNLCFTPDGNSIISPVGNRITIYDLKNNKSKTLSVESRYNYSYIAISPNGNLLIAGNESGDTHLISMISCTIVHRHKFKTQPLCIKFSPNSQHFVVAVENVVLIFKNPGEITGEYNPFFLENRFRNANDNIVSIDWSSDSRFLAFGSKDHTTRIVSVVSYHNFRPFTLSGHTNSIVASFFEENSLHLNTISANGQLCLWECSLELKDIVTNEIIDLEPNEKRLKSSDNSNDEYDIDEINAIEKTNEVLDIEKNTESIENETFNPHPFTYKKLGRYYLANEPSKESGKCYLTAACYHKKSKILAVAFSTGAFYLYELPSVTMIQSLSISDFSISTICFNNTGDWLALAASGIGQLLVWEWQSEQYIMKQQGHSSEMNCISYSPDGQYIATGGEDSKVKLWNINNGFCFVTFSEHTSGVTDIQFSNNKKFLVSSSLDGTVRAYDMIRYRNFRTFTSPRPVQFSCVALDYSGELVVAGGQDVFEIFLWSIKLGRLLEILSGHEGPVSSVCFSPNPASSSLVSGSWDKTIKIWNCIETSGTHETVDLLSDVLCVSFKPNGEEIAVATLNGNLSFFDVKTSQQTRSIEGKCDLGSGVSEVDIITAKKNLDGKSFTSITYSADGEYILAGGKSKNVCIYHIAEGILVKKFEITQNYSLDGMHDFINRRNITEFGNMALIENRDELEGGNVSIRLPGVQKGDMASRNIRPEIRVFSLKFSPTGLAWAAATTEGLLIYSLDKGIVFDPFNISLEITPKAVRESLKKREYLSALLMAIKLNEASLIQAVIEEIPFKEIDLVSSSLPAEFVQRVLQNIAKLLKSTPHIEFYLKWACSILTRHGIKDNVFDAQSLITMHESLSNKYEMLSKVSDFNKYTLRFLLDLPERTKDNEDKMENLMNENDLYLMNRSNISLENNTENSNSDMDS